MALARPTWVVGIDTLLESHQIGDMQFPKETEDSVPRGGKPSVSLLSHSCLRFQNLQVLSRYFVTAATVIDIVGHCFLFFPEGKIVKRNNRYSAHYLSSSLKGQNKNMLFVIYDGSKFASGDQ